MTDLERTAKIEGARATSSRPGYSKLIVRLYLRPGGRWLCRWDDQLLKNYQGEPLELVASFKGGKTYLDPDPAGGAPAAGSADPAAGAQAGG